MHYITDYATKNDIPFYHSVALAAAVRDGRANETHALTEGELAAARASKSFVLRAANKIGSSRELGAIEIANALLRQREHYANAQFINLSYNCIYR
jgi:hypothetical protein